METAGRNNTATVCLGKNARQLTYQCLFRHHVKEVARFRRRVGIDDLHKLLEDHQRLTGRGRRLHRAPAAGVLVNCYYFWLYLDLPHILEGWFKVIMCASCALSHVEVSTGKRCMQQLGMLQREGHVNSLCFGLLDCSESKL